MVVYRFYYCLQLMFSRALLLYVNFQCYYVHCHNTITVDSHELKLLFTVL